MIINIRRGLSSVFCRSFVGLLSEKLWRAGFYFLHVFPKPIMLHISAACSDFKNPDLSSGQGLWLTSLSWNSAFFRCLDGRRMQREQKGLSYQRSLLKIQYDDEPTSQPPGCVIQTGRSQRSQCGKKSFFFRCLECCNLQTAAKRTLDVCVIFGWRRKLRVKHWQS